MFDDLSEFLSEYAVKRCKLNYLHFPRHCDQSNHDDRSRSQCANRILYTQACILSCKIPNAICQRCAYCSQVLEDIAVKASREEGVLSARRISEPNSTPCNVNYTPISRTFIIKNANQNTNFVRFRNTNSRRSAILSP